MNKCVLCTFVKMAWNGFWDDTCPSVDKTKEEKPLGFWQGLLSIIVAVIFSFVFVFACKGLYLLLLWLLGEEILKILATILLSILGLLMVIGLIYGAFEFTKARIACIKAYWRKAKEACE